MTATMTGAATAKATVMIAMIVMATMVTKISESYSAWQDPALGSKGAAI